LGCHLGLSHYGHQFSRIGELYGLGLDFLKVDTSFIRDIQANPGNQAFLAGLRDTAHKIGMRVLAEGVATQAELDKLMELGLDGVTGPVLGEKV
jgi:EAL domain-containing protein (putative c-di-GMP-specific phosphodiesterase class I)